MSWATFEQEIVNAFHTTETELIAFIGKIKTDIPIAVSDIEKGLGWIANQTPAIAVAVQQAETLVAAVASVTPGVASNVGVQTAINAANDAVTALNAFASSSKAGSNAPTALVSGYVAYTQAVSAAAAAKAAAAAIPTPASRAG